MTTPNPWQLHAEATELILDRLEADRQEDHARIAQLDVEARSDPAFQVALAAAAFGIAQQLLDRLATLDGEAADAQMASFREVLAEMRRSS